MTTCNELQVDTPARFCDHFIDGAVDPWGGTYCKLLAGHEGEHSPHYTTTALQRAEKQG